MIGVAEGGTRPGELRGGEVGDEQAPVDIAGPLDSREALVQVVPTNGASVLLDGLPVEDDGPIEKEVENSRLIVVRAGYRWRRKERPVRSCLSDAPVERFHISGLDSDHRDDLPREDVERALRDARG